MPPEPEFSEYALKFSRAAHESRERLSPKINKLIDRIVGELTDDPTQFPHRVIPTSVDGSSQIYKHPDPVIEIAFQIDEERKILYFFHFSAPSLDVEQTIFISYSHEDADWLKKIRKFLTVLEQEGLIRFWDDSQLEAGVPWEEQIKESLDSAKAGLLLVSQEFLVSKFIADTELPRLLKEAEKKGKKIFWLHISASTVFESHAEITRFQSLLENPKVSLDDLDDAAQKRALVRMSSRLAEAVRS